MPKRLWNVDHQTAILTHDKPGVKPGDSHLFTDEQIEAGITGLWSDTDPRAGLKAEREFKRKRDAKTAPAETTEPAEPESKE